MSHFRDCYPHAEPSSSGRLRTDAAFFAFHWAPWQGSSSEPVRISLPLALQIKKPLGWLPSLIRSSPNLLSVEGPSKWCAETTARKQTYAHTICRVESLQETLRSRRPYTAFCPAQKPSSTIHTIIIVRGSPVENTICPLDTATGASRR